jgi:hypothetical protein
MAEYSLIPHQHVKERQILQENANFPKTNIPSEREKERGHRNKVSTGGQEITAPSPNFSNI